MKNPLFIISILFVQIAFSQTNDSLFKKYDNGIIYRYGSALMKGKDKLSIRELSKEFSMSDLGLDQFKIAQKNKTIGRVLLLTSLASGLAAISISNSNKNVAYTFLGGQFITLMGSIYYNQSYYRHLDMAILLRNKDYLFPGRQ